MTELTIRSDQADAVRSELRSALDSQRRMIKDSIKRTRHNLAAFEKKYGYTTSELLRREADGVVGDGNLELIEWIGESRVLERLQSELDLLDDIQICS